MKLTAPKHNTQKESIQGMNVGQVFRFGNNNSSFEKDLIDGEIFMIIPSHPSRDIDNCKFTDTTRYVRLSGQFEYVSRTGPIYAYTVEDDLIFHGIKSETTLEQLSPGDGVTFDMSEDKFIIVTDPTDTTKMVSVMNIITCQLIKLSKESDCNVHMVEMEIQ